MITGPSSYLSAMTAFGQHWLTGNTKIAPKSVILTLPDKTSMTQAQFVTLRGTLETQQDTLQTALIDAQIARGEVNVLKAALLAKFNLFTSIMDASYQGTRFYPVRPNAPGILEGKENFLRPLGAAMKVWKRMNEGVAPAGVTLPIVLGDGTTQGEFASAISALCFAYSDWEDKEMDAQIERGERNVIQERAYAAMKAYREGADNNYVLYPEMIETLPRLTPLPGHTPEPVNASVVFEAPDSFKVVYEASTEPTLDAYELRGHVGDDYDPDLAVVLGTNQPGDPREFVKTFGLTQPGAQVVLKVYVILNTGNEAGSPAMSVQRPLAAAA